MTWPFAVDTVTPVPDPMKMRSFYAPSPLWEDAKAKAKAEGTDISTVLRGLLEAYMLPVEPDPEGDRRFAEGVAAGRTGALREVIDFAEGTMLGNPNPTAE